MNRFAYGTPARLGTVCEGGAVATLYDCKARSSLYAATVLDGANMGGMFYCRFQSQKLHRNKMAARALPSSVNFHFLPNFVLFDL